MTQWNKTRGANLAAWRKRHGLTQTQLGARVGVSRATVGCWERNDRAPSAEQIEALHRVADALGGSEVASQDDAPVVVTLDMRGADLVCDEVELRERIASPRARGVDVDAPKVDPYTTTIDWQSWAVEVDGVRGISLRAMVDAGLYSRIDPAVRALEASGLGFSTVEWKTSEQGGRPGHDYLLTLKNAQRLAARAQTETGRRVLDLIIEHHDEFQALLNGDHEAHARLAEVQPQPSDPILASLAAAAETRRVQIEQEARLAALEHQMARVGERLSSVDAIHDARTLRPGEVYLSAAARHHGWMTTGDNAYPYAIRLSMACAGRPDHGVRRVLHPSPHDGQPDVEAYVISQDALMWWADHVRPWYEGQAVAGRVRIEPTEAAREVGMTRAANLCVRVGE